MNKILEFFSFGLSHTHYSTEYSSEGAAIIFIIMLIFLVIKFAHFMSSMRGINILFVKLLFALFTVLYISLPVWIIASMSIFNLKSIIVIFIIYIIIKDFILSFPILKDMDNMSEFKLKINKNILKLFQHLDDKIIAKISAFNRMRKINKHIYEYQSRSSY